MSPLRNATAYIARRPSVTSPSAQPLALRRLDHAERRARFAQRAKTCRRTPVRSCRSTYAVRSARTFPAAIGPRYRASCPRCAGFARRTCVSAQGARYPSSGRSLPRTPVAQRLAYPRAPHGAHPRRGCRPRSCRQPLDTLGRRTAHGRPGCASEGTRPPCAVAVQHAQSFSCASLRRKKVRRAWRRTPQSACLRKNAGMSYVSTPFSWSAWTCEAAVSRELRHTAGASNAP